jgi:hypothetical protein
MKRRRDFELVQGFGEVIALTKKKINPRKVQKTLNF